MTGSPCTGDALAVVRGVLGVLRHGGAAPTPVQLATLGAFAELALGCTVDVDAEVGLDPGALSATLTDPTLRRLVITLVVTEELMVPHPDADVARAAAECARVLGVHEPLLHAARELAAHHVAVMYADVQRHSWYNHETARRVLHGHPLEMLRSKLAALGGPVDAHLARKWRALGDCAEGTWGRAVHDFYVAHGFSFPGEPHSIRAVGAEHDWVHVLAGYETDPEGEIDVFTFIAGSMDDEQGYAMLAATLGLFQNGSIHRIAGAAIPIATSGAVAGRAAARRLADAFARGRATTSDVLGGIDHFEWADVRLDEARRRLNVLGKRAP